MKTTLSCLILVFLLSCQADQSKSIDRATLTKELRSVLNNYHDDIKKGGLTAEFQYLDNSLDFYWVPPNFTSALSYDSVRSILETNAPAFKSINFHWDTLQVFPLTTDLATYTGIVKGTMTDTTDAVLKVAIIESGTLIRRIDGWKLLSGQSRNLEESN